MAKERSVKIENQAGTTQCVSNHLGNTITLAPQGKVLSTITYDLTELNDAELQDAMSRYSVLSAIGGLRVTFKNCPKLEPKQSASTVHSVNAITSEQSEKVEWLRSNAEEKRKNDRLNQVRLAHARALTGIHHNLSEAIDAAPAVVSNEEVAVKSQDKAKANAKNAKNAKETKESVVEPAPLGTEIKIEDLVKLPLPELVALAKSVDENTVTENLTAEQLVEIITGKVN